MAEKPDFSVPGANKSMQENLDRSEPVIFASYGIVGAVLLLGGAGYLVDRWLGTSPWFLLAGLSVGLCVAFYALVKAAGRR